MGFLVVIQILDFTIKDFKFIILFSSRHKGCVTMLNQITKDTIIKLFAEGAKIEQNQIRLVVLPDSKSIFLYSLEDFEDNDEFYSKLTEIEECIEATGWNMSDSFINPEVIKCKQV